MSDVNVHNYADADGSNPAVAYSDGTTIKSIEAQEGGGDSTFKAKYLQVCFMLTVLECHTSL